LPTPTVPEAHRFTVESLIDKRRAPPQLLPSLLSKVPYEDIAPEAIELTAPQSGGDYQRPPMNEQFLRSQRPILCMGRSLILPPQIEKRRRSPRHHSAHGPAAAGGSLIYSGSGWSSSTSSSGNAEAPAVGTNQLCFSTPCGWKRLALRDLIHRCRQWWKPLRHGLQRSRGALRCWLVALVS